MATGVNIKMGVEGLSKFKSDIREAKESIKTLDAQLALTEKQFKATGDEEEYLKLKTEQLREKLEAQKAVAAGAEAALKSMTDQGVNTASKAYHDMIRTLANAKGDMLDTQQQLESIGTNAGEAGDKAEDMNTQLQNIGKGVAFENVTDGLGKVLDKLEAGARAAINFGKRVASSAMSSTQWADNLLTTATKYGISPDRLQRMENVADFIDTDVDTILNAQARLAKNKDKMSESLGIETDGMSVEDAFWAAGEAIMELGDDFEKEQKAQELFGRSWHDLIPLFTAGEEEYNRLLNEQNVLTDEQVENLGKADDAIKSIENEIERMKNQFWADNADKIIELGQWLIDNKDGIVTALKAIAGGFAALKLGEAALNIAKVVNGFKTLWGGANNPLPGSPETPGGGGSGMKLPEGMGGVWGASAIVAGFAWAANQRNNNPEAVRGTDANFIARMGGSEQLADALAAYMIAQREANNNPLDEAAWAALAEKQGAFNSMQGSQEALHAYYDWLSENSLKMGDLPEFLENQERMNEVVDESNRTMDELSKNMVKPDDLKELDKLPNAVADAVSRVGFVVELDGENVVAVINRRLGIKLAGE